MAYNPYFRYESDTLDLTTGVIAPHFPVQKGLSLHTYPSGKMAYTTTSRQYGTVNFNYSMKSLLVDDFETVRSFWESSISVGYDDFTIIDNKARMLFESSWLEFNVTWKKARGGTYDYSINIDSSIPWTPPCLGAYFMSQNNLNNHTLQGSNLSITNGGLVPNSSDPQVLRLNGYALRLIGDGVGSTLVGASGTVDWKSNINGSLSIFCQFRSVDTVSNRLNLASMTNSAGTIDFTVWQTGTEFGGQVNGVSVGVSSGTYHTISPDIWYDCAITYDKHNDNIYVYIWPSALTSFTNFLAGSTDQLDGIGSYMATPTAPPSSGYNLVQLLADAGSGGIDVGENGYVQNAMFFDGFISPMYFNLLRRLCYMWNNKTTEYPK